MSVKVPPEGIGVAGMKANVTVAHVNRAMRSAEAMVKETIFTCGV